MIPELVSVEGVDVDRVPRFHSACTPITRASFTRRVLTDKPAPHPVIPMEISSTGGRVGKGSAPALRPAADYSTDAREQHDGFDDAGHASSAVESPFQRWYSCRSRSKS